MKTGRIVPAATVFLFVWASVALSRDTARDIPAISVRPDGAQKFQLRSTDRLPDAAGEARVERKGGTTSIEVHLDSLKPASLFGCDYNTYLLWFVPPGGSGENLGELQLEGNQSRGHASTEATVFTLLIT